MKTDCEQCKYLLEYGRAKTSDPLHCIQCHLTWTGNEAQHCSICHRTFSNINIADAHRRPTWDDHIDPSVTPGWRELRPNVWTNAKPMTAATISAMKGQ